MTRKRKPNPLHSKRSVSVSAHTFALIKAAAEVRGMSMRQFVEDCIEPALSQGCAQ